MFGFGAHSVTYTPHRYKTLKTFAHKPNRTNFLILRSLKSFNKMQRHLITFIQIHVRAHSIAFRCVFSGKFLHHIRFFSSYFTCTQAIHVLPSFRFEVFNGKSNLKKKKKKGNFEVEKKMRRWWRWWKYRENRKWKVKKIRSWMGRKYMTNKTGWAGLMCIHVSLSGNKNCCAIVWL